MKDIDTALSKLVKMFKNAREIEHTDSSTLTHVAFFRKTCFKLRQTTHGVLIFSIDIDEIKKVILELVLFGKKVSRYANHEYICSAISREVDFLSGCEGEYFTDTVVAQLKVTLEKAARKVDCIDVRLAEVLDDVDKRIDSALCMTCIIDKDESKPDHYVVSELARTNSNFLYLYFNHEERKCILVDYNWDIIKRSIIESQYKRWVENHKGYKKTLNLDNGISIFEKMFEDERIALNRMLLQEFLPDEFKAICGGAQDRIYQGFSNMNQKEYK